MISICLYGQCLAANHDTSAVISCPLQLSSSPCWHIKEPQLHHGTWSGPMLDGVCLQPPSTWAWLLPRQHGFRSPVSKIGTVNYSQFHSLTYTVQKKQHPVPSHCCSAYFTQTGYHMLVNQSAFLCFGQNVVSILCVTKITVKNHSKPNTSSWQVRPNFPDCSWPIASKCNGY